MTYIYIYILYELWIEKIEIIALTIFFYEKREIITTNMMMRMRKKKRIHQFLFNEIFSKKNLNVIFFLMRSF